MIIMSNLKNESNELMIDEQLVMVPSLDGNPPEINRI